MSLKAFHLLFIVLSVMLTAFFAAWAIGQYRAGHQAAYLLASVVALASSGGLAAYAAVFRRKTRNL